MRNFNIYRKVQLKSQVSDNNVRKSRRIRPEERKKKEELDKKIRESIGNEFSIILTKEFFTDQDREMISSYIYEYIYKHQYTFEDKEDQEAFVNSIIDDIFGLGVIQTYLENPDIQEIWVIGPDNVYYETFGKRVKSPLRFRDNVAVVSLINKILAPINRKADESTPNVDARLEDGSRVAVTLPPLSLRGPQLTIRKFKEDIFGLKEYVETGSASQKMADFLSIAVKAGLNILVAGGTGSGKTTLLNALSNEIPTDRSLEHIITIEDSAELQMFQPFVTSWETKSPNTEGKGEVTSSQLLKHALRNSPDRIILGEMRDQVAQDVIQAVNTGHDGTMSTIHAENPSKTIERFASLATQSGITTYEEAKKAIGSSFDLIVFVEKFFDVEENVHFRKITHVTYIAGSGSEGASLLRLTPKKIDENHVFLKDIYGYDKKARKFFVSNFVPRKLISKAKENGYDFPLELFKEDKKEGV